MPFDAIALFLLCSAVLVEQFFSSRISLCRFRLQLTNESHPHLEYRLLLLRCQILPPGKVFKLSVGRHIVLGMDRGHYFASLLFDILRGILKHGLHIYRTFLRRDTLSG